MAQKVLIRMSGNVVIRTFTMNNTSIGENMENRRKADVELVQFFLWEFFDKHRQFFGQVPLVGGQATIVIDGVCGRQTKSAISLFQKLMTLEGRPIRVDGVVDVTKSDFTPSPQAIYTIWWLNRWFSLHGSGTPAEKENLETHMTVISKAPHLVAELVANPIRTII